MTLAGVQPPTVVAAALRAMRPHYWLKNVLLFLPLAVAGTEFTASTLLSICAAAAAFGCAASASYLINDWIDLKGDRDNPQKGLRPIAAGKLRPSAVATLIIVLLVACLAIAAMLPVGFQLTLAAYLLLCSVYSLIAKQIPILDVIILVVLYDLRLLAGFAAISLQQSLPLVIVGTAVFTSLALTKRVAQISRWQVGSHMTVPGLGYAPAHLPILSTLDAVGIAASAMLSLYFIQTSKLGGADSTILLATSLALCVWLTRLLVLAKQRRLSEDLVMFVLRDPFGLVLLATVGTMFVTLR